MKVCFIQPVNETLVKTSSGDGDLEKVHRHLQRKFCKLEHFAKSPPQYTASSSRVQRPISFSMDRGTPIGSCLH